MGAIETAGLDEDQQAVLAAVRDFVEREVLPQAHDYDARDAFPEPIVAGMREMGLFGMRIGEDFGGMGLDLTTYALAIAELSRGWMSISGILNTHVMVADMIERFGTAEQRERYLPQMAEGTLRASFSMSEPGAGSDVQSIRTTARRDGDEYVVDGQKLWVTNGLRCGLVALLLKTDATTTPPHRGMTCLLVEKTPGVDHEGGLTIPPKIEKLGYKGVETTELIFDGHRVPTTAALGGVEGAGFQQMMSGIEIGRVNVAARGLGVATRAFELAVRYAQERVAFGKPIAQHQAIQFKLAEMATDIEAARLMVISAARRRDAGERSDVEAGMAKLFCTEAARRVVEESLRIHGGFGYSKEYEIERLYRDVPLLLIGEGTSEIQKLVIARGLLRRHAIRDGRA